MKGKRSNKENVFFYFALPLSEFVLYFQRTGTLTGRYSMKVGVQEAANLFLNAT